MEFMEDAIGFFHSADDNAARPADKPPQWQL
jgi:hypothetical protein